MEFIIGSILLIIVLIIIGSVIKRKYFAIVDQLEMKKIELMNRPVLDEVGKIKQLKMVGQVEEYFERWRSKWDVIVTETLPNVEEWLYDAEEYIDKFRFNKAKEIFAKIEQTLADSENEIDEMIQELNELISSEEKNKESAAELQELFKELKKDLLAHNHAYGDAAEKIEEELKEIEKLYQNFEDESENGNYLIAREMIVQIEEELKSLQEKMQSIPLLLNECQHKLPLEIRELRIGIKEMYEQGYYLEHLGVEDELDKIEKTIATYVEFIKNLEIDEVSTGIEEIKANIEMFYELLENEVEAKKFVKENDRIIRSSITKVLQKNNELNQEVETVKLSYHLSNEDEALIASLEDRIVMMKKSLALIMKDEEASLAAYSAIKEKLEELIKTVAEIESQQETFANKLRALRKDELEARNKVKELRQILQDTIRTVERSNVPGIPAEIETRFLDAQEALQTVFHYLEQKPLVMAGVQKSLAQAEEIITKLNNRVIEMIENVYLIETIIQYGNRYRRNNPQLDKALRQAEDSFRSFDYTSALETAATAVEAAEPGALKRIEAIINEEGRMKLE